MGCYCANRDREPGCREGRRKVLRVLLALVTAGCWVARASAVTRTVCASGCDYTSIQPALDAADGGDIIEVAAGEVFTENIVLPHKWSSETITLRSSRWQELPPKGYRVNPEEHAALMPKVQPANGSPLLRSGGDGARVIQNGVDIENDTITLDARVPVETWLSCGGLALPALLTRGTPYTVTQLKGTTVKLSHGGAWPAIDFTDAGSAGESYYYSRPYCTPWFTGSNYGIIGIDFSTRRGLYTNITIQIGWDEAAVGSTPHDIEFDRVLVRGLPDENGPRICMALNGRHISVTDSWIGHCKAIGEESKGISLVNSPGPTLIKNNYLAGASLGILTAGQGSAIHELVVTDLTILNNHIVKPGYMLYKSGAGPPSGACYYGSRSGSYYRDTSIDPNTCADGACYECQPDGTWAQRTTGEYRKSHYLTKSGIELKDCLRCVVEGNIIEGVFAGPDVGNASCVGMAQLYQGGGYHFIGETVVRNNWCKDTWSGIVAVSDTSPNLAMRSYGNVFRNNLATGMGRFPELSMWANASDVQIRPISISAGQKDLVLDHNTFRYAPGVAYKAQAGIFFLRGPAAWGPAEGLRLSNTILQAGYYNIFADGSDGSCGISGLGMFLPAMPESPKGIANVVLYEGSGRPYARCPAVENLAQTSEADVRFVSDSNPRLAPNSPYSASCSGSCAFAGTDGTDLGADIDVLEEATSGVVAGTPPWSVQANLHVEAHVTGAVVSYTAPDPASCTLNLYTAAARVPASEHGDTSGRGQSLDARAGNVFDGLERRFILGTNVPLAPDTEYYYLLRCRDRVMPGGFHTLAAAEPQP